MSRQRTVFYAGSFDPPTNGHLDILRRALGLADRLVVGIGVNPAKTPLFTVEERTAMLREAVEAAAPGADFDVVSFTGLAVEAAAAAGATLMVRGLREGADLDFEAPMAAMNATMAPGIETVFLAASPLARPISATLVRDIARLGGDASPFVPPAVAARLARTFPR